MPRALLILVAFAATARAASAVPPRGAALPSIVVTDTDGKDHALPGSELPLLVFYEDRQAGTQNHALHKLISDVVDRPENRGKLTVIPVGDVEGYDFWPARGIATKVIRARAAEDHARILCDWKGALRKRWGLTRHKSGNVLVGGDGRVLFAAEGPLSDAQAGELLARLAELGVAVK